MKYNSVIKTNPHFGLFKEKLLNQITEYKYHLMIQKANHVHVCNEKINAGDFKQIVKVLMNRNKHMVNNSDYVIGQFENDTWNNPKTKSGTADCLQYAKQMGKTIQLFQ